MIILINPIIWCTVPQVFLILPDWFFHLYWYPKPLTFSSHRYRTLPFPHSSSWRPLLAQLWVQFNRDSSSYQYRIFEIQTQWPGLFFILYSYFLWVNKFIITCQILFHTNNNGKNYIQTNNFQLLRSTLICFQGAVELNK